MRSHGPSAHGPNEAPRTVCDCPRARCPVLAVLGGAGGGDAGSRRQRSSEKELDGCSFHLLTSSMCVSLGGWFPRLRRKTQAEPRNPQKKGHPSRVSTATASPRFARRALRARNQVPTAMDPNSNGRAIQQTFCESIA